MNTGEIIDTTNLILKPGNNNMDNEPFIKMLRDDGSFTYLLLTYLGLVPLR